MTLLGELWLNNTLMLNTVYLISLFELLNKGHNVCIFVISIVLFVCLGFFVPLEEFFTHMETSPLPVKGCKLWPVLGTDGRYDCARHWWPLSSEGSLACCLRVEMKITCPLKVSLLSKRWKLKKEKVRISFTLNII